MTLTNHMLTGAALAKFLPLPVAIPLAIASHFVLDALPHFGFKTLDEYHKRARLWSAILIIDITVALLLSWWLIQAGHISWFLVGLLAYSPDFAWVTWLYKSTFKERFSKVIPLHENRFAQFHARIQKYERPWGVFVELTYGTIILFVLR